MNITDIRQQLHKHPDVSGCEQFAHDLIVRELIKLKPDNLYDHVGGYGVVAYWKPNGSDCNMDVTIAFRADIDALPIGHRCGHDGHTAIMLRFAEIVSESSNRRYGILIVFQPEEETGKGAKKIVESGLLEKHGVRAVFGLHNLPGFPIGTVVLNRSTFAAASCGVHYTLVGRETHASTPEKGLNPGLAIAEIIQQVSALNSNVSNSSNTKNNQQFTQTTLICCRIGEEAFGTSAGKGEVMFTLRTFTNSAMNDLMATVDRIAADAAEKYGLGLEKRLREPFAATENTPEIVDQLASIFKVGNIELKELQSPFRWSEDFAEYLKVFSGAFFGVGSGEQQPELHNPSYVFPDQLVEPAAHFFELIMQNIKI